MIVAPLIPATSPVGLLEQRCGKALALAVAQVLAQQHRGPVASLGAAGTGLDLDEAGVRVGGIGEHAPEFDRLDAALERECIALDGNQRVLVVLGGGQFEQLARVRDPRFEVTDPDDDVLE